MTLHDGRFVRLKRDSLLVRNRFATPSPASRGLSRNCQPIRTVSTPGTSLDPGQRPYHVALIPLGYRKKNGRQVLRSSLSESRVDLRRCVNSSGALARNAWSYHHFFPDGLGGFRRIRIAKGLLIAETGGCYGGAKSDYRP